MSDCGSTTLRPERQAERHGMSGTPEYRAWLHLRERCLNPEHPNWHNYGGRGITVCDEWRASFSAFYRDMGTRPSPAHTIERADNEKGYCKENCVWATRKEQADNRRNSQYHEIDGERRTQTDWARHQGIPQCTISLRLKRGWSKEEALTQRPRKPERLPIVEFNGETHTLFEWSRITGIDYRAIHSRFKRGWDVARMLTQPTQQRRRKP